MAIMRVHKNKNFTVMSNYHLKEKEMSLKAKGLLSVMLSLPDNWDYSVAGLVAICKENETAINNTLKELEKFGYLKRVKKMPNETKSGYIEYEYNVYEKPIENQGVENQGIENQGVENLGVDNLGVDNQGVENQGQLNTKIPSTKKENTKKENNYFSSFSSNETKQPISSNELDNESFMKVIEEIKRESY